MAHFKNPGETSDPTSLGTLIQKLAALEAMPRPPAEPAEDPRQTWRRMAAAGLTVGAWAAIDALPGIGRLRVLCELDGEGLTAANVLRLRARICKTKPCKLQEADALTLVEAADVLEALERWRPVEDAVAAAQREARRRAQGRPKPVDLNAARAPLAERIADYREYLRCAQASCNMVGDTQPEAHQAAVDLCLDRFRFVFPDIDPPSLPFATSRAEELRAIDELLRTLSEMESATAEETPAGETAAAEPGSLGENDVDDPGAILRGLACAVRQAYLSYVFAESKAGRRLRDTEAYDLLRDEGLPESAGDLGELEDYKLPALETWTRYLRNARAALKEQKYTRRTGRTTGKSVIHQDEL